MTRIGSRQLATARGLRLMSIALGLVAAMATVPVASAVDPDTAFYVPKPNHGAIEQIALQRVAGA